MALGIVNALALESYGDKYKSILDVASNTYIMCDQYHGNCYGNVDPFWTEYRNYYGTNKSTTNWMHVIINNGNGNFAGICPGNSNSWYDLIGDANDSGINKLWLYAYDTGAFESAIEQFGNSAWRRGWLRKFGRKTSYYRWKCVLPEPCDCDPNDTSQWVLYEKVWTSQYREVFP